MRSARWLLVTLMAVAVSGCGLGGWRSQERIPAFRTALYGAGLDSSASGRRIDIVERNGGLVARYRVSSGGLRVYGPDATQLGRVRVDADGWRVLRVDETTVGRLEIGDDRVTLEADSVSLVLEREDDAWSISLGGRPFAQLTPVDTNGAQLTYVTDLDPRVRFEDGNLSVQTHADARQWMETEPLDWHPVVLVVSRLDVDGLDPVDLALIRGALVFGVSRNLGAELSIPPPPAR